MTKGGYPEVRARRLSGLFVTVILAVLAHAVVARAEVGASARHFRRGQAAMSEGDPSLAVREFLAAWRAEPSAKTLLAVAIAYEAAGDRASARAYYWWYLNSGAAQPPEQEWLFPKILALSNPAKPKAEPPAALAPAATTTRTRPALPAATLPPPSPEPPPPHAPPPPASTKQPAPQPPEHPAPRPQAAMDDEEPPPRPAVDLGPPTPPPQERVHAPPESVHARPSAPAAETAPTHSRWYGLPMLILEPVALATVVGGAHDNSAGVVTIGVLGMIFISPIVHGYHDHGARGWGGFFLRAGGTAFGGLAAGSDGAVVGYALGFLSDALLLARDDVPDETSVVPTIQVGDGRASFGLAGAF